MHRCRILTPGHRKRRPREHGERSPGNDVPSPIEISSTGSTLPNVRINRHEYRRFVRRECPKPDLRALRVRRTNTSLVRRGRLSTIIVVRPSDYRTGRRYASVPWFRTNKAGWSRTGRRTSVFITVPPRPRPLRRSGVAWSVPDDGRRDISRVQREPGRHGGEFSSGIEIRRDGRRRAFGLFSKLYARVNKRRRENSASVYRPVSSRPR